MSSKIYGRYNQDKDMQGIRSSHLRSKKLDSSGVPAGHMLSIEDHLDE